MNHLKDLPVLVLGLGESGLAMARWCVRHGASVTVWDSREAPPQLATLQAELPAVRFFSGALGAEHLVAHERRHLREVEPELEHLLAVERHLGLEVPGLDGAVHVGEPLDVAQGLDHLVRNRLQLLQLVAPDLDRER